MLLDLLLLTFGVLDNPLIAVKVFDDGTGTLAAICERESGTSNGRCGPTGVHRGDSHLSTNVYFDAVRVGYLRPLSCILHTADQQWATRGSFGQIAAFAMQYTDLCLPAAAFDFAFFDAWIASKRLIIARESNAPPRLRSWAFLLD